MCENVKKSLVRDWAKNQLTNLLGFDVPPEFVEVVLSKNTDEGLDDLKELLDFDDDRIHIFLRELKQKEGSYPIVSKCKKKKKKSGEGNNKKSNEEKKKEYEEKLKKDKEKTKNDKEKAKNDKEKAKKDEEKHGSDGIASHKKNERKRKSKYIPVPANPTEEWLIPGRYWCQCEAQEHNLVNNCMKCGRIVCEQEGSGPCFFCGSLVCTKEEEQILNQKTDESNELYQSLLLKQSAEYQAARNSVKKLMQFDKECTQRTKVIDDSDYYNWNDVWLNPEEKARLKEEDEKRKQRQQSSKYIKKITVDMKDLSVKEVYRDDESDEKNGNNSSSNNNNNNNNKGKRREGKKGVDNFKAKKQSNDGTKCDKDVIRVVPHIGNGTAASSAIPNDGVVNKYKAASVKLYDSLDIPAPEPNTVEKDDVYEEMEDRGYCLSIRQPYASLVMSGMKKHEGRMWYSSYRGRLWIASAKKQPSEKEVNYGLSLYRHLVVEDNVPEVPTNFPLGVILGYVAMVDCLPQDEYRLQYPNGEIDDPYVFIFENPKISPNPMPTNLKPHIFKMDPKCHILLRLLYGRNVWANSKMTSVQNPCSCHSRSLLY